MRKITRLALVAAAAFIAAPASATDTEPCGKEMVCASDPKTIVAAIQDAGFKAKLEKDDSGDPMISSAAAGYTFSVYFYGCEKNLKCDSIQFVADFKADDDNVPAYANAWNRSKRFVQASVNDKKELYLRYDVTTVGGLNRRNFADALDWWNVMLGEFATFVDEQVKLKEEGAAKTEKKK